MLKFIFSIPQRWRIALSLACLGVITALSLAPSNDLPSITLCEGFDKVVHASMYFGLTLLTCWTFQGETKTNRLIILALFSITWGLLMEISQLEMSVGRAFEWSDELSNTIGTLIGVLSYVLISINHNKSTSKNPN